MSCWQELAGEALDSLQRLISVALHVSGVIDDVTENALLVDDVGDAADHAALFIPRAERLGCIMVWIAADEPVTQPAMLREGSLARNQIDA